jgi:hypothetical protein
MIKRSKIPSNFASTVSALVILYLLVGYAPSRLSTEFDDAYMFCRYASNFLSGNGFSWNPADGPSYGITSPAYLLLVTLAKLLTDGSNSLLLSILSLVAGVAALLILVVMGFKLSSKEKIAWYPLLVIPLLFISSSFRYHLFTGMETTLSLVSNSLLVLAAVSYMRISSNWKLTFLIVSAVFTVQVRPDNGIFAILFPILLILSDRNLGLKQLVIFGCCSLIILAFLQFAWSRILGSFLPISFYAKSGGEYYEGYAGLLNWNQAGYILRFVRDSAPFLTATFLLGGRRTIRALPSVIIPLLLTFIFLSRTVQVMGWFARYYFPFIPFLILLSLIAIEERLRIGFGKYSRTLPFRVMIVLLILVPAFHLPLHNAIERFWENSQDYKIPAASDSYEYIGEVELEHIPWWTCIVLVSNLVGHLPEGVSIAASENGFIASENLHAEVIDLAGLHDLSLAKNGFSAEYLLNRRPDMIWMPHWDYVLAKEMIEQSPFFRDEYVYYPGAFNYGIALRKQSPFYDGCYDALQLVFCEAYPGRELEDFRGYPSS